MALSRSKTRKRICCGFGSVFSRPGRKYKMGREALSKPLKMCLPVSPSLLTSSGRIRSGLYSRLQYKVSAARRLAWASSHFTAMAYRRAVLGSSIHLRSQKTYSGSLSAKSLCSAIKWALRFFITVSSSGVKERGFCGSHRDEGTNKTSFVGWSGVHQSSLSMSLPAWLDVGGCTARRISRDMALTWVRASNQF